MSNEFLNKLLLSFWKVTNNSSENGYSKNMVRVYNKNIIICKTSTSKSVNRLILIHCKPIGTIEMSQYHWAGLVKLPAFIICYTNLHIPVAVDIKVERVY